MMLLKVTDVLFEWKNRFGKHYSHVLNLTLSCLMRIVWKE